ncbi:rubrerythrin [bacterium endosymbiont of Escarpia laminata]|nr:MAG: rubrerythrin [bacterium endosymbiont of Escarpia laminata]RLJ21070.1 MAG: rubrerythrin [bacterium endosymbiont of Escarpia laminata]
MSFEFNADEVFEMAEQIERNGAEFYRKAAGTVIGDPAGRDFLIELARMEEEHEDVFSDIRKSLTDDQRKSTVADLNNEAIGYLRSLADTRVFFQKEIDTSSMEEILKAAIMTEKDSIAFYLGMKEMVPERGGKDKIDQIIQEEMSHIRLLSQELITRRSGQR